MTCCCGCVSLTKSAVWAGVESIEMHVPVTFKYSIRVCRPMMSSKYRVSSAVSDVYSYSFGFHRYLIKKSDHNE